MLGNQLPRQSSTSNISIEIDGAEDGSEKVFDTFDCVRGRVLVSVHRKTELEKIDITFEAAQHLLRLGEGKRITHFSGFANRPISMDTRLSMF
ncbi:hypothetical protein N7492_002997 [Penicillium capsulatum]|uniref:Uncharacterized protein n=1 Tax=Penicillium capsulatum TaxID=69766 RepID=A0A9W9IL56_9EURO|nr:hypothetical protein N7492_002997 [Penicillium capsulatum]KAJ6122412.1 hypothetical protein N7512_004877 [Penicillium capsulatum]